MTLVGFYGVIKCRHSPWVLSSAQFKCTDEGCIFEKHCMKGLRELLELGQRYPCGAGILMEFFLEKAGCGENMGISDLLLLDPTLYCLLRVKHLIQED